MSEKLSSSLADLRAQFLDVIDDRHGKDTRETLAHVDLDEEGPYAVAEALVTDYHSFRRWRYRLWACRSWPTLPPNIRRFLTRKLYAVVTPDGAVIDNDGFGFESVGAWLAYLEGQSDSLPDLEHASMIPEDVARRAADTQATAWRDKGHNEET